MAGGRYRNNLHQAQYYLAQAEWHLNNAMKIRPSEELPDICNKVRPIIDDINRLELEHKKGGSNV